MSEPHESHHKKEVSPNEMQPNTAVHGGPAAPYGQEAAAQPATDRYYDIYQPVPKDAANRGDIEAANAAHARLYHAVRWLLIHDFSGTDKIPLDPRDFPGTAPAREVARFASVYGLLLADDWDPAMGQSGWVDPFQQSDPQYDGRFVAALVGAVQEYTTSAGLFEKVLEFLRVQGPPGGALASAHVAGHA
jgi:hypothetical protein